MASSLLRRRRVWVPLAVLFLFVAVGVALYLSGQAAPEAARLLPENDGVIYVDLRPLRAFSGFGKNTVVHDPEYDEFVKQTGFQLERDLNEAAIAIHPPEPANDPLRPGAMERRFSQVLVGTFDSTKLTHYLHVLASDVERYHDTDVFLVPHEGRKVRAAILTSDMVAVSNSADSANIKGIIDRFHQIALPSRGPALVRAYYRHVPLGSPSWAILRLAAPGGGSVSLPLPNGLGFALPKDTVTVASLRYLGNVVFRAEAFTTSNADAKKLTESVGNFLDLFHSIETNAPPSGSDPDVRNFFESIKVEQDGSRAVLTANLPVGFVKKMMNETPMMEPPSPNISEQKPAIPKARATHTKRRGR